jgi:hypothetical protein
MKTPWKVTSFPRKRESSSSWTWTPAYAGVTRMGIFIQLGGPKAHENSVESHVIPAQAGIHTTWAPAFAGATRMGIFIQLGGPQAHENSVESHVIPAQAGIHTTWPPLSRGRRGWGFSSNWGGRRPMKTAWKVTSFPRKRESSSSWAWTPAYAGVTA